MSNKTDKKKNIVTVFLTEFIRIKDVVGWSLISFVGFILGISALSITMYIVPFLVFLICILCITSFTFAINNYFDADSDRENPRRMHINAIASGKISKQTGIFFIIAFAIIPLLISFFYKFEVFLFSGFLLFFGWSYSAPPLRLKGKPVMDVIWHFFGFFFGIIWSSLIVGPLGLISWLVAFSLGVFSAVGQVCNHIIDYSFDRDSGTKTFAVWTGIDNAKKTANALSLIHLLVLISLFLLYSLNYIVTIGIVIIIAVLGFLVLRPKKGAFPTRRCYTFYFNIVLGGAVYLSCMIYHLLFIVGTPTLGLLNFIGIP
ncbi:MAG: UbiA family prenyltransferase [Thermoplasmatales archaeon]|nr:UbiA family prenyltransferase [Thermoplasmatales archaeon]